MLIPFRQGAYADPSLTPLERTALGWLDSFYQLEHLLATRAWALRLCPQASEALRLAALLHDAERFFPGGPLAVPAAPPDDPDYLMAHSRRSADIVEEWLRGRPDPPPTAMRAHVRRLILRHELGGNPEEDVLQAADSLSFLSTFDWLAVEWVTSGRATQAQAQAKLDWMLCRIRLPEAVALGLPHYRAASLALEAPQAFPFDLVERRALAGNLAVLTGTAGTSAAQPAAAG
jgi:hypothetical protein